MRDMMILYFEEAEHLRSPTPRSTTPRASNLGPTSTAPARPRACAAEVVKDLRARKFAVGTINRSLGTMKRGLRLAWERGLTRDDCRSTSRCCPRTTPARRT
jgi:hypothetical protein